MENSPRRYLVPGAIAGVIVILIGAYFLFQYEPSPAVPTSSATSTPGMASSTTSTSSASTAAHVSHGTAVITAAAGGAGSFGVTIDTTGAVVGGTLPPFTVNLPPDSDGKVLEFAIQPTTATSSLANGILFATTVNTDGLTYQVSGLRLSNVTDGMTGQKSAITPGSYKIETILWDKNPFTINNTYGSIAGNNATAVLSGAFTVAAQ